METLVPLNRQGLDTLTALLSFCEEMEIVTRTVSECCRVTGYAPECLHWLFKATQRKRKLTSPEKVHKLYTIIHK